MDELEEIVEVHAAMVRRIATVYERYPDKVDDLVQMFGSLSGMPLCDVTTGRGGRDVATVSRVERR